MVISLLGALLNIACLQWVASKSIVILFMYLTNWLLMLSLALFILDIFKLNQILLQKLFITTWCIGWNITIVFWICINPSLPPDRIPLWLNLLSHGGIHFLISFMFYKKQFTIENRDFIYPGLVITAYTIIILIPFKYSGITVYPRFLDELIPSIFMILLTFSSLFASFYIGKRLTSKSKTS